MLRHCSVRRRVHRSAGSLHPSENGSVRSPNLCGSIAPPAGHRVEWTLLVFMLFFFPTATHSSYFSCRRAAQLILGRAQVHGAGDIAREGVGGGWRPPPAHGRGEGCPLSVATGRDGLGMVLPVLGGSRGMPAVQCLGVGSAGVCLLSTDSPFALSFQAKELASLESRGVRFVCCGPSL